MKKAEKTAPGLITRIKKTLSISCISFILGCFFGIHRKVIFAKIKGGPVPKAPSWHFWVKE